MRLSPAVRAARLLFQNSPPPASLPEIRRTPPVSLSNLGGNFGPRITAAVSALRAGGAVSIVRSAAGSGKEASA